MLTALHKIAERKIEQAIAEGKVPDLSHWKNKRLPEDDTMQNVPADLRLAYKMLETPDIFLRNWHSAKKFCRRKNCSPEQLMRKKNISN